MSSRKSKSAFTLIELLVVVSIIALLVSILLPALGKAREQAKSVLCMTRQRQVGLSVMYYMDDWNDMLFPQLVISEREGYDRYWVGKLREYLPDTAKTVRTESTSEYGISEIFFCPSYKPFSPERATNWAQCFGWRQWAMDDSTVVDTGRYYKYRKMSRLSVAPADFYLMADSMRGDTQWYVISLSTAATGNTGYVHARHGGKANALFADGRVEARSPSYFEGLNETQSDFHIRPVYKMYVATE